MKIIVTCGSPWLNIQKTETLLSQIGVKKALQTQQNKIKSIENWHDKVIALSKSDDHFKPIIPSKPWEKIATDIFIENIEQECWGWVSSKTTWLLDFWLKYDENFQFILIYAEPFQDLANVIANEEHIEYEQFIQTWVAYHKELLKFYNRHSERCILVNELSCHHQSFYTLCQEKFDIEFDETIIDETEETKRSPIAEFIAKNMLTSHQEINHLFAELETTATHKTPSRVKKDSKEIVSQVIQEYHQLEQSCSALKQENLLQQQHLGELEQQHTEIVKNSEISKQEAKESQQQQNKELMEENELLLLQLHQVQEELEHLFLNQQAQIVEESSLFKQSQRELQKIKLQDGVRLLLNLRQQQQALENSFYHFQQVKNNNKQQLFTQKSFLLDLRKQQLKLEAYFLQNKQQQQTKITLLLELRQQQYLLESDFVKKENESLSKIDGFKQGQEVLIELQQTQENLEHQFKQIKKSDNPEELPFIKATLLAFNQAQQETESYFIEYQ